EIDIESVRPVDDVLDEGIVHPSLSRINYGLRPGIIRAPLKPASKPPVNLRLQCIVQTLASAAEYVNRTVTRVTCREGADQVGSVQASAGIRRVPVLRVNPTRWRPRGM